MTATTGNRFFTTIATLSLLGFVLVGCGEEKVATNNEDKSSILEELPEVIDLPVSPQKDVSTVDKIKQKSQEVASATKEKAQASMAKVKEKAVESKKNLEAVVDEKVAEAKERIPEESQKIKAKAQDKAKEIENEVKKLIEKYDN